MAAEWKALHSCGGLNEEDSMKLFCNSLTSVKGFSGEFTGTCTQRQVKAQRELCFVCERSLRWGGAVHRWWDSQMESSMTELNFDVITFWSWWKQWGWKAVCKSEREISRKLFFLFLCACHKLHILHFSWGLKYVCLMNFFGLSLLLPFNAADVWWIRGLWGSGNGSSSHTNWKKSLWATG